MSSGNIDVLFVMETWLSVDDISAFLVLTPYNYSSLSVGHVKRTSEPNRRIGMSQESPIPIRRFLQGYIRFFLSGWGGELESIFKNGFCCQTLEIDSYKNFEV